MIDVRDLVSLFVVVVWTAWLWTMPAGFAVKLSAIWTLVAAVVFQYFVSGPNLWFTTLIVVDAARLRVLWSTRLLA